MPARPADSTSHTASPTRKACLVPARSRARSIRSGAGLLGASSPLTTSPIRCEDSTIDSNVWVSSGGDEAREDHPETAVATGAEHLCCSTERANLGQAFLEQLVVELPNDIADTVLDPVTGNGSDEPVTAHTNGPVQLVGRHVQPYLAKRLPPRHRMHVDRVDQCAVEVEQNCFDGGHHTQPSTDVRRGAGC